MLFIIIKDSIILFLLIYAVIDLFHHLIRHLKKTLTTNPLPTGFYVIDTTALHTKDIEGTIRLTMVQRHDPILLIIDEEEHEAASLVQKLCLDFNHLIPITRKELISCLSARINPIAFSKDE